MSRPCGGREDSQVSMSPWLSPGHRQTRKAAPGYSGRPMAVPPLTCPCSAPAWGSIRYVARPSEKTPLQTERGVSGCGGARPPGPPVGSGVLTAGPGSWRERRRSGAAPGSGPGSSSAPPRPAERGRALSLGSRPAPHPQGPHPGWGLWGSLPGPPRVCLVPTAPRDPPLEGHPQHHGSTLPAGAGHPGAPRGTQGMGEG